MRSAFARRTIPNALRWIASTPRFGLKLRNAFFPHFSSSLLCLNLPLGSLLEGDEFELERGNWVAEAHKAITQKLAQLRRSITLDSADASDRTFANQQRQRLFNEIQAEIRKVFGPGRSVDSGESEFHTGVLTRSSTPLTGDARWAAGGSEFHEDYPVNAAGVAQDAAVLANIEDVLAAFADADAFAAAHRSGGLFATVNRITDENNNPLIDPFPTPSEIFTRPRGKLSMVSATTDLTRFGAWRHQVSTNGVTALAAQTYARGDRGREFGAFAYSPLAPTAAYTSVTSRIYPARGAGGKVTASYVGETVAAQDDLFYKGAVEATVFWDPGAVDDSRIRVTISDLAETETDMPLQVGYYQTDDEGELVGVEEVGSLTWTANIMNEDGVVKFSTPENYAVTVGSAGPDPINYKPPYNDQLRFGFSRDALGGGMYQNHYRLGVDANADNNRHFQGATSRNWGLLTLQNVVAGGTTTAATAADRTALAEQQEMLQMPRWVISGAQVNTTTSTTNSVRTWIFIYVDGSMLQFTQQEASGPHATLSTLWGQAIGVDPARPASVRAVYIVDDPMLSANNGEHLYTRRSSAIDTRGYPTQGGANGIGHPSMLPHQLFKSYVEANRYVNIEATDTAARAATLEGMFVGQDADGPLGLIGNWTLTSDAFGVGETRGTIRGAFGADFQP